MSVINTRLFLTDFLRLQDYRSRVIASGVALLFVYTANFVFQFLCTYFREKDRAVTMRKLLEVCQVMYWFGVATMFSMFPPFYYGAFNTIIAYITLVVLVLLHILCLTDRKVNDRSLFSITYFFYHLLITIWLLVGLILAYIWSRTAYEED